MPIHDWTRLEAGDFHDFHQCWVVAIRNALNGGLLPPEYMAMAEQITGRPSRMSSRYTPGRRRMIPAESPLPRRRRRPG